MVWGFCFMIGPQTFALAFVVTPPGRLDFALTCVSNARPGFLLFCEGRPLVGAEGLAGKMPDLLIIER